MRKTNIYDLGYIYISIGKENEHFLNRGLDNKFSHSYLLGGIFFFFKFFAFLFKSPFKFDKSLAKDKKQAILVFGESTNNRNTLLPIIEMLGKEDVIDLYHSGLYPKWRSYWYAIPHLGHLISEIRKNTSDRRDTIKTFFPKFWLMYGCHKTAGQLLDFYKPKAVVMANDHLPFHRSLMHEANDRGIPTVYVQHAAVTEKFPPLSFTYSLLDGEDSYNKYKQKDGTQGSIYLSGGIRFDAISKDRRKDGGTTVVGVAINLVDDEELVKEVCLSLRQVQVDGKEVRVILRPHPQMKLDMWREWCEQSGIGFSNAKEESSFNFLYGISVLVSNQSSIHLDAAMCHIPSVVYRMSEASLEDSYSFVKNGLVIKVNNLKELASFIQNSKNFKYDEAVVRYYNCSYGTEYEGKVAQLMADLLSKIPDKIDQFNLKYHFELIEADSHKMVFKTH